LLKVPRCPASPSKIMLHLFLRSVWRNETSQKQITIPRRDRGETRNRWLRKKGVNPGPWRARPARLVVDREILGSVLSSVLAKLSANRFAKAKFFDGLALVVALTATFLKAFRLGGWASGQGNGDAPFSIGLRIVRRNIPGTPRANRFGVGTDTTANRYLSSRNKTGQHIV